MLIVNACVKFSRKFVLPIHFILHILNLHHAILLFLTFSYAELSEAMQAQVLQLEPLLLGTEELYRTDWRSDWYWERRREYVRNRAG